MVAYFMNNLPHVVDAINTYILQATESVAQMKSIVYSELLLEMKAGGGEVR